MNQDSISQKILERIHTGVKDDVYIVADFLDFGEYDAIRKALIRLETKGEIQRILLGVYYAPQYSSLINEYEAPSPNKVAEALARKYNWTIAPCGDTALNQLGLSTQVPSKWSYISDGPYREVALENLTIEFKHRNNREISGMSTLTAMIIQALKALGKDHIDSRHIGIIRRRLSSEEKKTVMEEAQQSNMWIYNMVKRICAE